MRRIGSGDEPRQARHCVGECRDSGSHDPGRIARPHRRPGRSRGGDAATACRRGAGTRELRGQSLDQPNHRRSRHAGGAGLGCPQRRHAVHRGQHGDHRHPGRDRQLLRGRAERGVRRRAPAAAADDHHRAAHDDESDSDPGGRGDLNDDDHDHDGADHDDHHSSGRLHRASCHPRCDLAPGQHRHDRGLHPALQQRSRPCGRG